jgi:hypothetical protein
MWKKVSKEEYLKAIGKGIEVKTDTTKAGSAIVVDYKTTSSLSAPTKVARPYWFQQCLYVWLARQQGYKVDGFRLVFITTSVTGRVSEKTGKPMKDYPSTVTELDYLVSDIDMEIIENSVKVIADSVQTWRDNPGLRYILAQDYRLKLKSLPKSKLLHKNKETT